MNGRVNLTICSGVDPIAINIPQITIMVGMYLFTLICVGIRVDCFPCYLCSVQQITVLSFAPDGKHIFLFFSINAWKIYLARVQ